jgi:hypothetical protein
MAIWDILDVVAAVGTSGVGSLMFLSFGFPNSIVTPILLQAETQFGLLSPTPFVEYTTAGCIGASFALSAAAINIHSLFITKLSHEKDGQKTLRRVLNLTLFLSWMTAQTYDGYFDLSNFSYQTGSYLWFWNGFFVACCSGIVMKLKQESLVVKELYNHFGQGSSIMDAINAVLFLVLGVGLFTAASLHFIYMQIVTPELMTCFGLLENPFEQEFGYGLETFGSGCWALAIAVVNLGTFCGDYENEDYKDTRRLMNIIAWFGIVITFTINPGNDSFYNAYLGTALLMALILIVKNVRNKGGYNRI